MSGKDKVRCTVLVAEDHEDTREVTNLMLNVHGCRVIEAKNGLEAVKLAVAESPDLILMDLSMPVLDGFLATRQIREHEALREVPIIAVSAHYSFNITAKALEAGCDEVLAKPLSLAKLEKLIERFISAR